MGRLWGWGDGTFGQCLSPELLSDCTCIAAGAYHSLAARSDGTVVGWGPNTSGEATPPANLRNVVAVGRMSNSLALTSDGSV